MGDLYIGYKVQKNRFGLPCPDLIGQSNACVHVYSLQRERVQVLLILQKVYEKKSSDQREASLRVVGYS